LEKLKDPNNWKVEAKIYDQKIRRHEANQKKAEELLMESEETVGYLRLERYGKEKELDKLKETIVELEKDLRDKDEEIKLLVPKARNFDIIKSFFTELGAASKDNIHRICMVILTFLLLERGLTADDLEVDAKQLAIEYKAANRSLESKQEPKKCDCNKKEAPQKAEKVPDDNAPIVEKAKLPATPAPEKKTSEAERVDSVLKATPAPATVPSLFDVPTVKKETTPTISDSQTPAGSGSSLADFSQHSVSRRMNRARPQLRLLLRLLSKTRCMWLPSRGLVLCPQPSTTGLLGSCLVRFPGLLPLPPPGPPPPASRPVSLPLVSPPLYRLEGWTTRCRMPSRPSRPSRVNSPVGLEPLLDLASRLCSCLACSSSSNPSSASLLVASLPASANPLPWVSSQPSVDLPLASPASASLLPPSFGQPSLGQGSGFAQYASKSQGKQPAGQAPALGSGMFAPSKAPGTFGTSGGGFAASKPPGTFGTASAFQSGKPPGTFGAASSDAGAASGSTFANNDIFSMFGSTSISYPP
jgi:hypothetical protein